MSGSPARRDTPALELLRRLARHPHAEFAICHGVRRLGSSKRLPALARIWDAPVAPLDVDQLAAETDAVFLALPDTLAANSRPRSRIAARGYSICPARSGCETRHCASGGIRTRPTPLDAGHVRPDRTLSRRVRAARGWLRAPGCYPTAAVLALQPLVAAGLLEPGVIIDAKSGISGAGKTPTERTHFSECHGSIAAYGVFAHRHAAEIEQELGTAGHVRAAPGAARPRHLRDDLRAAAARHRRRGRRSGARVRVCGLAVRAPDGRDLPEIKHVAHTNFCDIGWRVDGRQIVMVACIDNLVKGAAGQAIQNFNVAFGFDETRRRSADGCTA